MNTQALYACCATALGPSWHDLSADARHLVARDVESIATDPTDDAERACYGSAQQAAYLLAKRIGNGNLASYGETLLAGERRRNRPAPATPGNGE